MRSAPGRLVPMMRSWFDAMAQLGLEHGTSFDLDFHTIPFHGEDALVEKHYVSKRSRRQKGILAFLAQDGEKRFFCYANAHLRKDEQNDEVLRFVEFWKQRTGRLPEELIFDSPLGPAVLWESRLGRTPWVRRPSPRIGRPKTNGCQAGHMMRPGRR